MSREEAIRLDRMAMFIQQEWDILLPPVGIGITSGMAHLITVTDILEYIFLGKTTEDMTIEQYENIPSRLLGLRRLAKDVLDPLSAPSVFGSVTVSSDRIIELN